MKRSVSNLIMTFVGALGDVIWYSFLGWSILWLIANLTVWILTGIPSAFLFNNLDIKVRIIAVFVRLISFAFTVIMVYNLRLLLKNISRKQFFFIENYRYIRVIGFALIITNSAHHILIIVMGGMKYFIRNDLPLGEIIVFNVFQIKFAILGIIFLALAEVFRNGALMHEEQQLTV